MQCFPSTFLTVLFALNVVASLEEKGLLKSKDKKPVLNMLDIDIQQMEDLKAEIKTLQRQLEEHADMNIIDSSQLEEENYILKFYKKLTKEYEDKIVGLKALIERAKHKFNDSSLEEIALILEEAENYLATADKSIENVALVENGWESLEESVKLDNAFAREDKNMLMKEKMPLLNMSEDLQSRLFIEKGPINYPLDKGIKFPKLTANNTKIKQNFRKTYSNATVAKIKEAKIELLEKAKAKIADEEAVDDLLEESLKDDARDHLSPEVEEAFEKAANASKVFIAEKLVQSMKEDTVPPSLLPGMAVLALVCLLLGVFVFGKTRKGRNAQRRLFNDSPTNRGSNTSAVNIEGATPCGSSSLAPSTSPWNAFAMTDRSNKNADKLK